MAVAMFLRLRVPPRTYDVLMQNLEWDLSPPVGEILHVAAEVKDGIEVCEVWQTSAAAEAYVLDVLGPSLVQLGVKEQIEYSICPLHNLFAADLDMIERIGAVSLPGVAAGSVLRR